jgi:hypothetical protein
MQLEMRAVVNFSTSHVVVAAISALFLLKADSCVSAQDAPRGDHLHVRVTNRTDFFIGPGRIEIRADGTDKLDAVRDTGYIPINYRGRYQVDARNLQIGSRYRVIYRAECEDDASKTIYARSIAFVLEIEDVTWRFIDLEVNNANVRPRVNGRLVRMNAPLAPNASHDIHVKPGDLLEIDYVVPGLLPTVIPKGGSHPDVVDVSTIGPRQITENDRPIGTASYFEAKSRGDDWVSIEIDGVPLWFRIWVGSN